MNQEDSSTTKPTEPDRRAQKDPGIAVLLALIFGPLGLLYLGGKYSNRAWLIFVPSFFVLGAGAVNSEKWIGPDNVGLLVGLAIVLANVLLAVFAYRSTKQFNAGG